MTEQSLRLEVREEMLPSTDHPVEVGHAAAGIEYPVPLLSPPPEQLPDVGQQVVLHHDEGRGHLEGVNVGVESICTSTLDMKDR